jgi:hypothetical protein
MIELMVWFTSAKLSKHSHKSQIIKQVALDIHHGTAFGFVVPHAVIEMAGDNEGGLRASVPETPGILKKRIQAGLQTCL